MAYQPTSSTEIAHALTITTHWARGYGLELNLAGTGFADLEDALVVPIDQESRRQFANGAGGELNRMHSLRSSSALAYNIFAPWKVDPSPVASILGGSGAYDRIGFEAQYPTGVSSRPPHLDVLIDGHAFPLAIESKFLEIYDDPKPAEFSRRYLEADHLWVGLPNLRLLAADLADDPSVFVRLGASQLLKHTLGLTRQYGHDGFRLVYLWYEVSGDVADTHRLEVERFTQAAANDIEFHSTTHHGLFGELRRVEDPVPGYRKYLAGRYGLQ